MYTQHAITMYTLQVLTINTYDLRDTFNEEKFV